MKCCSLIILIFIYTVNTYPSRPLNERSTELAWQAWLLVDQSRDLALLRKRITPKSVFIAPTFSPESLPECAEGYKSDAMGRCVKIIKINEAAHLDFLLQKLNEQFGDYEEEEDEEDQVNKDAPTPGPFQVNIPLIKDEDEADIDLNESEDFALILTPRSPAHLITTTSLPTTTTSSQKNNHSVKRKDNDKFNVNNIAEILGVRPEDIETTTMSELTTTTNLQMNGGDTTTENEDTTTLLNNDSTTTPPTDTTTTTSLLDSTATTTTIINEDGAALFFQMGV